MTEQPPPAPSAPEPGWYPDPSGSAPLRWWGGHSWAHATHDPADAESGSRAWSDLPSPVTHRVDPNDHPSDEAFPEYVAPPLPTAAVWPVVPATAPAEQDGASSAVPPPYPDLFDGPAQSDEQRRRSRRGLRLALGGIALLLVLAVAVVGFLLVSARGSNLDTATIETEIAGRLSDDAGAPVTVSCPDSVPVSAGTTFDCAVTADDGSQLTVVVRQVDDQGNVVWRIGD